MKKAETDKDESGELREVLVMDIKRRKFPMVQGFQQCRMQKIDQIFKRRRGILWISHLQVRGDILKQTFQKISEADIHISDQGRDKWVEREVKTMDTIFIIF